MRVEVLCTGNELLDGSVVNSNVSYLAGKLHALGIPVARVETVPDDLPVIASALRQMGERSEVVVACGGLGPTLDDLTVEAAAAAAGVALRTDGEVLERIKERFAKRGFKFTENNARQARVPVGGQAVANPFGTAPMIALRIARAEVFLLPGVPREFRGLCDQEVVPRIATRASAEPGRTFRRARVLRCHGIGESHLDASVDGLAALFPGLQVGFRTHAPENHLKLLAEADTPERAESLLAAAEAHARSRLGSKVFGIDSEELPEAALAALQAAGATVALAESCTGGLCASLLASVPGASRTLVSSAVVYQDQAKSQLLGLDPELVRRAGAVSPPVTRALAEAARARSGATFGLAITGWAGPGGGTATDPVGTVYLCLTDGAAALEQRHVFGFDRERVRRFAAFQALDLLRLHARGLEPSTGAPP